jgi:hypothetical protein
MESYLGIGLMLFMAALALGAVLKDQKTRGKLYLGALPVYLAIGWSQSASFQDGMGRGFFLYIFLFVFPFQLGHNLSKLTQRKKR